MLIMALITKIYVGSGLILYLYVHNEICFVYQEGDDISDDHWDGTLANNTRSNATDYHSQRFKSDGESYSSYLLITYLSQLCIRIFYMLKQTPSNSHS